MDSTRASSSFPFRDSTELIVFAARCFCKLLLQSGAAFEVLFELNFEFGKIDSFLTVKRVGGFVFGIFFKIGVDLERVRTFGERPVRQRREVRARGQVVAPALARERTQRLHAPVIRIVSVLILMLICVVGQFRSKIFVSQKLSHLVAKIYDDCWTRCARSESFCFRGGIGGFGK